MAPPWNSSASRTSSRKAGKENGQPKIRKTWWQKPETSYIHRGCQSTSTGSNIACTSSSSSIRPSSRISGRKNLGLTIGGTSPGTETMTTVGIRNWPGQLSLLLSCLKILTTTRHSRSRLANQGVRQVVSSQFWCNWTKMLSILCTELQESSRMKLASWWSADQCRKVNMGYW